MRYFLKKNTFLQGKLYFFKYALKTTAKVGLF